MRGRRTKRSAQRPKTLFNDLFKNEAEFLTKLSEWDKERRKYPYDWKALSRLQNELNSQLSSYLYKLKQIESKGTKLETAVDMGKMTFSALGFELGRQGAELTYSTAIEIYYGSASEAVAESLVVNTAQNHTLNRLLDGQALEKFWNQELSLPISAASSSSSTGTSWKKEVIEPMVEKLSAWIDATTGKQLDYGKLIGATRDVLHESLAQRLSLDNRMIASIPDYLRDKGRDALSLLSDGLVNKLDKLRDGADLEQRQDLDEALNEVKTLREDTITERLAKKAADQGLSKFWSEWKDAILDDIKDNVTDGKELKGSLETAFNEGLGGLLDKWSAEMKKVPKHSAEALHEATWNIRFAVRRYRNTVNAILKAQPS